MTWFYSQDTGILRHELDVIGCGYSGNDLGPHPGKNQSAQQSVHQHGPLPCGLYLFAEWIESHPTLGRGVIALQPSIDNRMFGRSGFCIHGDNPAHPGQSSDGCIVYGHTLDRRRLWDDPDHYLEVIES